MSDIKTETVAHPAVPLPASTVVLVRPTDDGGFEIFMNRRPDNIAVYAGTYVFPGGRVEKSDYSPEMLALVKGLTTTEAQQKLGRTLNPELCVGFWVAAVRELFEEAGVHFFISEKGASVARLDDGLSERLASHRVRLQRGEIDLASILSAECLYCDVTQLTCIFHRTTPEHYPVRFDTHFYIAALPPHQTPLVSSEEVSESIWLSADEALRQLQAGSMAMMPPTVAVLRTLAGHASWKKLNQAFPLS